MKPVMLYAVGSASSASSTRAGLPTLIDADPARLSPQAAVAVIVLSAATSQSACHVASP